MKILTINAGSSSLKFQVIDSETEKVLIKGHYDEIGRPTGIRTITTREKQIEKLVFKNHEKTISDVLELLISKKIVNDLSEINTVAHRIVHGGEKYQDTLELTEKNIKELNKLSFLAPLHNPINIKCIKILKKMIPKIKHFGVFDTAFHSTLSKEVFLYGLPIELYEKFKIRKYGFHGTSHKYVSSETARLMKKPIEKLKIITCHLGNGQSICAVKNGISIDTSMGFTPLEGLPMGTRSGSFDPEIVLFLLKKGYSKKNIKSMINKKSGLLGVSKISSDMREIYAKYLKKDKSAELTINLLANRILKIIGSYVAEMNGVDAIVFTAGLGESAFYIREKVLEKLEYLDLKLDIKKNRNNETLITTNESKVKAFVIPTNEELQMMRDVLDVV